jgi:gp16 family phage-associated protein
MKRPPYPSTAKQARAWFQRYGICIVDWCKRLGLDYGAVTDVLREKSKGSRGKAHRAAIALGIKEDPDAINKKAA